MANVAKKHLVDGRWVTVAEIAEELGLNRQQLYSQMHARECSLQVVVNNVRDGLALGEQGHASRHWVDGRWMTVRQAAEMLGVSRNTLYDWMHGHRRPDGRCALLSDAVEAYRSGAVKRGGSLPKEHRVGGRTMTTFQAAEKLGVSVNAIRRQMNKRKASLAATIRYYERRKQRKAEKEILEILKGSKP